MEKQRVLIVHNYYQIPGGEDTVVANEKKMLEENGHKVFMYTRHNNEIKDKGLIGKLLLPFETIYSLKTSKEIKKVIKENKIDVVHIHNTLPLISPSVYSAAKSCGVKVVQTVHNFRLLCPGATFYRNGHICEDCLTKGLGCAIKHNCYRDSKIQTIVATTMLKFNRLIGSYDKVDAYIALTEFNKNKLSNLIPEEKIFVKPNFTEEPNIPIVPVEEREYFMFLGRLDKLKGIDLLVKAWKDIKDEKLVIVGTGPEEEWIKSFISENKMSNVEFLGFRKKDEAMKILSKAKALIVPSQCYEGFPMTIVEAFAIGVPVIGSEIGNVASISNIKFTIANELINRINYRIESKEYEMSHKLFVDNFNKKINYHNLMDIYKY